MKYESQYKSVFHKPVRILDDKTEMQAYIVFPILIHGSADMDTECRPIHGYRSRGGFSQRQTLLLNWRTDYGNNKISITQRLERQIVFGAARGLSDYRTRV